MNNDIIFLLLIFYLLIVFSAYGAPILLYPQLAADREINIHLIGFFFSAFPIGSFPSSLYVGKIMGNTRKFNLLMFFNFLSSVSRFLFGFLVYVDEPNWFFVLSFLLRFITGVAEGALIPIIYSYVPDLYPNDYIVKYGILEFMGSVGIIIGSPLATLLFNFINFFWVFASMGIFNLVVGTIIIFAISQNQDLVPIEEDGKTLPLAKTFFSPRILMNFLYLSIFAIPNYMILAGLEKYITTLSNDLNITAALYSLIFVGLILGVLFIKFFYVEKHKFRILFISGVIEMALISLYGPEPLYGITDSNVKLILIGLSFLVCGLVMDIIFLLITDILLSELMILYPKEPNLCRDFSSGLFIGSMNFDELAGPILGTLVIDNFGYERIGSFCMIFELTFFLIYWAWFTYRRDEVKYDKIAKAHLEEVTKMTEEDSKMM